MPHLPANERLVTNEATVVALLLAGMGPFYFNNFCEYLDMPGLHQKTFNEIAKRFYSRNEILANKFLLKLPLFVRREHIHQYHLYVNNNDIIDISVSFYSSWLKKSHKSLIRIGCVIDVLTGLIIDGHVCSLHCRTCAKSGEFVRRETPQRYRRWREEHIASSECTINFEGSPSMMEVKAVEVLWNRSVECHEMRYTRMGHQHVGHSGLSGNYGWADTTIGAGFAYLTNHLTMYLQDDPRQVSLRQAFLECFSKYKSTKSQEREE
ncbi:hypothetical protein ElyMa_004802300 [Elysia marginata]|uniref:Mutator-like transposase domain-containing protein n=1 Tax=Elysia marginata TaxID=1093978 RepID=A0AAV4IIL3_9GAST|nr:hypothetical protein ElyMa_004802300 [Elysia marginata]